MSPLDLFEIFLILCLFEWFKILIKIMFEKVVKP